MKNVIILENIRSAYNVGNVIRTADALGRDVRLSGYSPSPEDSAKVRKTALGAEAKVSIKRFDQPQDALVYARNQGL
jgi:tRNA G18 (ribose-2'-O)-methylase SpoU